mmetsp:Transcript_1316/g.1772  ORF Transcript_1316/g.1772 Transcript_1316/m.1772 type:complete len:273 (-) Transcript_1316:88-906(-)
MKGNTGPRCKRFRFVVLVVKQMNVFVHPLVGVKCAVHPVDANFHKTKVQKHVHGVVSPSPDFCHSKVGSCPSFFHDPFVKHGQQHIESQTTLRQSDLIPHNFGRRANTSLLFKCFLARRMNVAKVMENSRHTVIDNHGTDKVSQITQEVVTPFQRPDRVDNLSSKFIGNNNGVNVGIEIPARVFQWFTLQHARVRRRIRFSAKHIDCFRCSDSIQPVSSRKSHFGWKIENISFPVGHQRRRGVCFVLSPAAVQGRSCCYEGNTQQGYSKSNG